MEIKNENPENKFNIVMIFIKAAFIAAMVSSI